LLTLGVNVLKRGRKKKTMNKTTYTVTRFDVSYDFYVEVTEENNIVSFVLCRENFGIKLFMFGMMKKAAPPEKWEEIINNNVNDHIQSYLDEYDY
jgi:hypothetical protein